MRRLLEILIIAGVLAGIAFWFLTAPSTLTKEAVASLPEGDATKGELVFAAAGCASCHAADGAKGADKLALAGGHELDTPFGIFRVPNISQSKERGIGAWSLEDFANAMVKGVSPDGSHYYPAFPYGSYTRMQASDISDLFAYMKTLPASENEVADHSLSFPYTVRRGLGLWKLINLDASPVIDVGDDPQLQRGRYLVEAMAHCAECHTPRDFTGGLETGRWMAGAPNPSGRGGIPNISPHENGIASWSAEDIVNSLETGFTPEFDSFGGSMVAVQENMAKLSRSDLEAIAAYLKAIPAVD